MSKKSILMIAFSALSLSGCKGDIALKQPEATKAVKPLGYLLDVNSATEDQLARVPGLTPEIHRMIMDIRPFLDMVEFDEELDGIKVSTKKRAALYQHLFMKIDINNTPIEDLQFVPNLSNSLSHKVKTGRPYNSLSELRAVIEDSRQSENTDQIMEYFIVKKAKN